MNEYEKKTQDGQELTQLIRQIPPEMRDKLVQRIAGMVEGAALVQAATQKAS